MSGIGENSSDPARAESRKRKECPDQLGPRCVKMLCSMLPGPAPEIPGDLGGGAWRLWGTV